MTARRTLGTGPQSPAHIRAVEADLLDSLAGIQLPDVEELRDRGVLAAPAATAPAPRQTLGAGRRADEDRPDLSA